MRRKRRCIVVRNYRKRLSRVDAICAKYMCGYEVRADGTAVIIID